MMNGGSSVDKHPLLTLDMRVVIQAQAWIILSIKSRYSTTSTCNSGYSLYRTEIPFKSQTYSPFVPRITLADAKGSIYLTTKNGTFPLTLSPSTHTNAALDSPNVSRTVPDDADYWDRRESLWLAHLNETSNEELKGVSKRSINDAVSKNITLVLENLLKNYENSQLPTHGKGKAVRKRTCLHNLHI